MSNVYTVKLLNEQITHEMSSAYLYLSMAIYAESQNLLGFAHWLRLQFLEEQGHGERLIKFLFDIGTTPELLAIEKPRSSWSSITEVFAQVLSHEKKVTSFIWAIKESAINEKDYATSNFIEWFIKEQVEEEATAQYILDKLTLCNGNKVGEMILDKELGTRKD